MLFLIPVVLVFCGLCAWGVVARICKDGTSGLTMALPIGLLLVAMSTSLFLVARLLSSASMAHQSPKPKGEALPQMMSPREIAVPPPRQIADRAIAQVGEIADKANSPVAEATSASAFDSDDPHAKTTHLPIGAFFLVVTMLGVALLIGLSVFLAGQGGSLRLRDVGAKLASVVWIVPALVVVAFPLWKSGRLLSQSAIRPGTDTAAMVAVESTALNPAQQDFPSPAEDTNENAPQSKMPEWATRPLRRVGKTQFVVVSSRYNAALNESERQEAIRRSEEQIIPQAIAHVRGYLNEVYPIPADWSLKESLVRGSFAKRSLEVNDKEFGKVYRSHVQLELSPRLREQFYPFWKERNVRSRLIALAAVLAVMTLLLGTTATYLRLDRMTEGVYRGRLKLASLSFITAGALVAGLFLA